MRPAVARGCCGQGQPTRIRTPTPRGASSRRATRNTVSRHIVGEWPRCSYGEDPPERRRSPLLRPFAPRPARARSVRQLDTSTKRVVRKLVGGAVLVAGLLSGGYAAGSVAVATRLVADAPRLAITQTPAAYGLAYAAVTFPARGDGVRLRGWFIPGVRPNGTLTAQRALIVVHGKWANRTDPAVGLLDLSHQLVLHGFAVLAFDLRGMGESPPAPLARGYLEQRDVLGAVDFLRRGPLPFPTLGRPQAVGGWGVSMGATSLLLASAREPSIVAVVADSPVADILPIIERDLEQTSRVPAGLIPGALVAARGLYGIDFPGGGPGGGGRP